MKSRSLVGFFLVLGFTEGIFAQPATIHAFECVSEELRIVAHPTYDPAKGLIYAPGFESQGKLMLERKGTTYVFPVGRTDNDMTIVLYDDFKKPSPLSVYLEIYQDQPVEGEERARKGHVRATVGETEAIETIEMPLICRWLKLEVDAQPE